MRNIKIAPGEHYHIYNRAVNKQVIFHEVSDYARFLFLILYFQSPASFPKIGRAVGNYVKRLAFDIVNEKEVIRHRTVELVAFCIMPNHFHLIVKEKEEGGIAAYMHRVMTAYAKYYCAKYGKSGHVFQGTYKAILIVDDRQLLYLSAYIHRNPRNISKWIDKENQYRWSSYQDFVEVNRWGEILLPEVVLGQFKDKNKYRDFVNTSTAKLLDEELRLQSEMSNA